MTNLASILKNKDVTLPKKLCLVKAMVFPVVKYGYESCIIKKAKRRRIDAFELWCWRKLLRVPWTARKSNQSILKKISPEYSLEEKMLKLKLQYFGHLSEELTHWKRPWCWERLKVGGEGDNIGWDGWMASPTQWTWVWASSRNCDGQGSLACCSPWGHKESDLSDWTELNYMPGNDDRILTTSGKHRVYSQVRKLLKVHAYFISQKKKKNSILSIFKMCKNLTLFMFSV